MTRTTNTPSHDKRRLANKIRDAVPQLSNSDAVMSRITAMRGDKSLEEMEERDLRNILNATHKQHVR
jgi:hypothetical protein